MDEEYNITRIIDWEFASAEAKDLAFTSPCMMWPVADYYDGSNKLPKEEIEFAHLFEARGRKNICDIVLNSRRWQRFFFFLGGEVPRDEVEFRSSRASESLLLLAARKVSHCTRIGNSKPSSSIRRTIQISNASYGRNGLRIELRWGILSFRRMDHGPLGI